MMVPRPWWLPTITAVAAVGFLIAGIITWRMMSSLPSPSCFGPCPSALFRPRRLHPLRAEALWAIGGLLALIALASTTRLLTTREHRSDFGADTSNAS
jgi:hypothetical protein